MLKASSSGIVLTLQVHTNARTLASRVVVHRACPCRIFARFKSYSTSRSAVQSARATSLGPALMQRHGGGQHLNRVSPASPSSATGMCRDFEVGGKEPKSKNALSYGQIGGGDLYSQRHMRAMRGFHGPKSAEDAKVFDSKGQGKKELVISVPSKRIGPTIDELTSTANDAVEKRRNVLDLRRVLLKSPYIDEAWDAFQALLAYETEAAANHTDISSNPEPIVTSYMLRYFAHRLICTRPRSRSLFLRLLSVLARLRRDRSYYGVRLAYLTTAEWNALIHLAGCGMRKIRLETYNAALDVFGDMVRSAAETKAESGREGQPCANPDIHTYTTLLNIAVKTGHVPAITHATQLLRSSGTTPTRVTHLCTIPFRQKSEGLSGVRYVLSTLEREGLDIGIDGLNAFLQSAGQKGQTDAVLNVYNALRRNLQEKSGAVAEAGKESGAESFAGRTAEDAEDVVSVEGITFSKSLVPDEATYTFSIQTLAYHGDLLRALQIFTDMLSTRRPPPKTGFFQPSYAVFRALFCAYAKHGYKMEKMPVFARRLYARQTAWDWDRLRIILEAFFELEEREPSERMVYWIIESVKKVTGSEELQRDVWARLNQRFRIRKGGRLKTMAKRYESPLRTREAQMKG